MFVRTSRKNKKTFRDNFVTCKKIDCNYCKIYILEVTR
nr:MAG TPA: hypothetical protein [Caudoviricetes sp.]